jgi:hypothetical protein
VDHVLELKGNSGKTIMVSEGFIEFKQKSLISGTSERKIPITHVSSVEVKKPGLLAGYIQIAEMGTRMNKGVSSGTFQAANDENSVLFNSKDRYEMALMIKACIEGKWLSRMPEALMYRQFRLRMRL